MDTCGHRGQLLLLLVMLSLFIRVRLCATPETATHQAPTSLEFSRQEQRGGLPFPSPVHESEKWKWSRSVVSGSLRPRGLQPTRLVRPWDLPGQSAGVGCRCLLRRGQRGRIWETGTRACALPCVKQAASGRCCTPQGAQPSEDLQGWGGAGGRSEREGYRHTADSLCCPAKMWHEV